MSVIIPVFDNYPHIVESCAYVRLGSDNYEYDQLCLVNYQLSYLTTPFKHAPAGTGPPSK